MIKWLVNKINRIGEPKKSETNQTAEVISAIKFKNNQNPTGNSASRTFIDTKTDKHVYGKSGVSGKMGEPGVQGKSGTQGGFIGTASTSAYFNPNTFDYIGNLMERHGTEMQEVFDKIDSDLDRLLSGGSNIRPRDITKKNNKKQNKK
jgi:hypothetical protein